MRVRIDQEISLELMDRRGFSKRGIASLGVPRTVTDGILSGAQIHLDKVILLADTLGVNTWDLLQKGSRAELAKTLPTVLEKPDIPPSNCNTSIFKFIEGMSLIELLNTQKNSTKMRFLENETDVSGAVKEWGYLAQTKAYRNILQTELVWRDELFSDVTVAIEAELAELDKFLNEMVDGSAYESGAIDSTFKAMMDNAKRKQKQSKAVSLIEGEHHRVFICPLEREVFLTKKIGSYEGGDDIVELNSYEYKIKPKRFTNLVAVVPKQTEYLLLKSEQTPHIVIGIFDEELEMRPSDFPEFLKPKRHTPK